MALSSLRLLLLGAVERVLRRWLNTVSAQISAAPRPAPAESPDPHQPPAPPEHWLELVRQHAPQLLDSAEATDLTVYDYQQDAAAQDLSAETFQVPTRTPKARPASVITPHARTAVPVSTVRTQPKRPMHLGNVHTQAVDAEAVNQRTAQTDADALEIPTSQAALRDVAEVPMRRPADYGGETRVEREPADLPDAPEIPTRAADLPLQRHIREVRAGLPADADVPTVRTSAGKARSLSQRSTTMPRAPQQTVLRPTVIQPSLNVESVTPERWASLPDAPAEPPPDANTKRARRERLKREQEGRAWNG